VLKDRNYLALHPNSHIGNRSFPAFAETFNHHTRNLCFDTFGDGGELPNDAASVNP
jgi:outer membrane PBP1 activator LpoA protein